MRQNNPWLILRQFRHKAHIRLASPQVANANQSEFIEFDHLPFNIHDIVLLQRALQ
jgi:hypothetical protein